MGMMAERVCRGCFFRGMKKMIHDSFGGGGLNRRRGGRREVGGKRGRRRRGKAGATAKGAVVRRAEVSIQNLLSISHAVFIAD